MVCLWRVISTFIFETKLNILNILQIVDIKSNSFMIFPPRNLSNNIRRAMHEYDNNFIIQYWCIITIITYYKTYLQCIEGDTMLCLNVLDGLRSVLVCNIAWYLAGSLSSLLSSGLALPSWLCLTPGGLSSRSVGRQASILTHHPPTPPHPPPPRPRNSDTPGNNTTVRTVTSYT